MAAIALPATSFITAILVVAVHRPIFPFVVPIQKIIVLGEVLYDQTLHCENMLQANLLLVANSRCIVLRWDIDCLRHNDCSVVAKRRILDNGMIVAMIGLTDVAPLILIEAVLFILRKLQVHCGS